MGEPWRVNAVEIDCACAAQRKPCSYHEGYQDGHDAAARFGEATLDALRAEVERQAGIIAALDRTVEELSGENVALRAALAPFAAVGTVLDWRDAPDDLNPCPHIPMALYRRAAALLGDEEEG